MRWILWDFDGTLGYREGGWSGTVLEVLRQEFPNHPATVEQIHPLLQEGFPWHAPERSHPHLSEPDRWWAALHPVFEKAFVALGVGSSLAGRLASYVREVYLRLHRWRLFDDSLVTLERLSRRGWRQVLLSNHVPELSLILRHLGIRSFFAGIWNSAETGYEKPHPQAFRQVMDAIGTAEVVWMVGDNFQADIAGAAAQGIPGILVRKPHPEARYFCQSLEDVDGFLDIESRSA